MNLDDNGSSSGREEQNDEDDQGNGNLGLDQMANTLDRVASDLNVTKDPFVIQLHPDQLQLRPVQELVTTPARQQIQGDLVSSRARLTPSKRQSSFGTG